jgi:sortase (surface protein transpeptidase)
MDTPDGIVNAAWFDHSTLPWEKGSAIIDGHFWWKNGKPAVFNNLNKLVQWDRIYILEANWATLTFVVNKVKSYDLNDNAPEIFKVDDSLSHLNIITCHWTWDKDDKIYSDRLVVFADRLIE